VVQEGDQWRVFVISIINLFGFLKRRGTSLPARQLLDSQEGLCSMKLTGWLISYDYFGSDLRQLFCLP
jgi:hypothetical protein